MINCRFENGNKASLRHITVVVIIENSQGKVLITKRAPHLLRGGKYTIPGGFLDRNESAKDGILREVAEETGLKIESVELFRINDNPLRPKEDRQNVDFIFLAKAVGSNLKENNEVSEFKWIDEKDLPEDQDFAFDHRDSILRYFEYLKQPFNLPIIG